MTDRPACSRALPVSPSCSLAVAQVLRKLHVEGELRADEQDEPAQVDPDQGRQHDRKAGVDRHHLRGIDDECGEYLAHQRPDDPCRHTADELPARIRRAYWE